VTHKNCDETEWHSGQFSFTLTTELLIERNSALFAPFLGLYVYASSPTLLIDYMLYKVTITEAYYAD